MKDFNGKTAVITGGASGIGFAVARALAARGARLVLADVEAAALAQAVKTLQSEGAAAMGVPTDVRDPAAVNALADAAWQAYGGAHFVMHNAGVVVFGPLQDLSPQDWQWSLEVNLLGVLHGVQAFLPRMLEGGEEGHMLFTSSFAGLAPNRDLGPYNVTKAAVVALAESLHKDLRETPIGASVLCPMRVRSNIEASARNRPADLGGPGANRTYTEDEQAELQGRRLDVAPVAELVVSAVARGDLYIHTHKEAEALVRRRFERIAQSFEHAL